MEDSLLRPYASSLRSRACQDHCNLRPPSRRDRTELVRQEIRWWHTPHHFRGYQRMTEKVVHGFQKKKRISCVTRCTDETHRMAGCINQLQPEKGQISAAIFFQEIFRCKLKGLFCSYRLTFHTKFVTFWNISRPWKSRAKEKMRMLNLVGGWSGWCLLFNKCWFCSLFLPWGKKYFGALFVVHLFVFAHILRDTFAGSDETGAVSVQAQLGSI